MAFRIFRYLDIYDIHHIHYTTLRPFGYREKLIWKWKIYAPPPQRQTDPNEK